MAAVGILAALQEARAQRAGPDGRHLDDRRLALLARRWKPRRYFGSGEVPERGDIMLSGGIICYRPYEAVRRLGHLRRARAEVLAAVLQGGRPRGPDREAVREARLGCPPPGRRGLQGPHPRRVEGLQRRARRDDRADPRPRRGARLRAGQGARDGGRATSSPRSARSSSSASRSSSRGRRRASSARRRRSASTRRRCWATPATRREEIQALEESGAAKGPDAAQREEPFLA